MKIAIIGTGGVGGYFGGRIAYAGYDTTFLARGEHLKTIQTKGLTVESINGDFKIDNVRATGEINNLGKTDLIILGVKAWQIKEIAKELSGIVCDDSIVLPLQNGVTAVDELKDEIDQKNIIGGLCTIFSKIELPGVINHFGVEPTIIFGELNNRETERIKKIKEVFDESGIKSKVADNIQAELWKKLMGICVGGLVAATHSTYGEVRELKETRQLMIDLINEIYNLSQKIGITIESDIIQKTISFIDSFPPDSTSSLARDIWDGKPSEIEYLNGAVAKLGEKYGVATPVNRFIYNCILPLEKRARKNFE
jgi:2-dehydropantoate 2-reductase